MRHFYFFIVCLFATWTSVAQEFPLDFDDPLDEFSDAGSVFDIIADPNNSSDNVGQITSGGGQYDNVQLDLATYLDFTQSSQTITFDFYVDPASGITAMPGLLQFANSLNGGPAVEMQFTATPGWNTYTLDFNNAGYAYPFCAGCPNDAGALVLDQYSRVILFTDFAVTSTGTYLIDDLAGAANGAAVGGSSDPQVAANTPQDPASEVLSMFSNAYNDVPVDTWSTSWSAATFTDIQIANDDVKKYESLDFNGIETVGANALDLTNYDFMVMDVWTPNATAFRVKLVDWLGDGFQGNNGDTEAELTFAPAQNQWVRLNIPLSDFTGAGMTSVSDINQLIISADPSGTAVVYIDNVYFTENTPLSVARNELSALQTYPNPVADQWNLRLDENIQKVTIHNALGQKVIDIQPNAENTIVSTAQLTAGVYFAKVQAASGVSIIKLIKR
jgi:hypothetical protein